MKAEFTLAYNAAREAKAVANAVSPDNVELPPGLFVRTTRQKKKVYTRIECETRLQTFIASIDDLLACVTIAEKAFTAVKS